MALTITDQPITSTIYSVYRSITYVVVSSSVTISKVQCEVYVNGVLIKTVVHDPNINTGDTFTFDISGFVRDNISLFNPQITSSIIQDFVAEGTAKYIQCIFNEVLTTAGVLVVQATDYTSNTSFAANFVLQHENALGIDSYYQDNLNKLWFTNMPDNERVRRGETIGIPFVVNSATTNLTARIVQLDANEAVILTTDYSSGQTYTQKKTGWININTNFLSSLCVRITTYILIAGVPKSSQRYYRIVSESCQDDKRFWFLNQFGGFESFTFTGEFVEGLEVTSKDYKKALPYFTAFSVMDRGLKTFRVDAFAKFRTTSRPLNRTEYRWLRELKTSPEVFIQEGETFVPIVITDRDNYSIEGNDIGQPMTIEYVKANDLIIQ